MSKNCRFAVAVHIGAVLARFPDRAVTSDWIAGSVNTNAVVVRRILAALNRAGLVCSQRGMAGGSMLARPADSVTLLEIQRAVEEEPQPALPRQSPNPDCPVGAHIVPVLTEILSRADAAHDAVLAEIRLSDVVEALAGRRKSA